MAKIQTIGIMTSGGDAPGMNACIRACVRSAINSGLEVYGVERGYFGLVNNNIFPMDTHSVCDIVQKGGTILKTARCLEFKFPETRKKAADNLKALGIE
ncbi:6-phosphofructokinase, partial [Prevotella sp.]|uniref:6-phosphofructokinase n=1 Tax=Prevotella sp. TaxID=59823 RepID=UPI0025FC9193